MTRFYQNSAAAVAAIAIVAITWVPVINVPTAEAATLIVPALV
ncbi:hypothetical protein QWY75_13205 [Pontixanthobacter aestiaquae]|nr:hypothetical protein [Pontixanthobacter aestiaquae]MDN3647164.1 hypothetical protein [Pontixanthobacter aestiaquae]